MRIVYRASLNPPVVLEDHWSAPFMHGLFRPIEEKGKIIALEISFAGQHVDYAPKWGQRRGGAMGHEIAIKDPLITLVRQQLKNTFAFIGCYFDINIAVDEIEAFYSPETEAEEDQIPIRSWRYLKARTPQTIPYDFVTRAIMAAEKSPSPTFEATLVGAARTALLEKKFIDSFRYSFLLIEAMYGNGKFKSEQLKDALKSSNDLQNIIAEVLENPMRPKRVGQSETDNVLAQSPTVGNVLDHLVERRGFYFHGNMKRKDSWRPEQQQAAETLALLAAQIAMGIGHLAATPMFAHQFVQRHFENAKEIGAIMTLSVAFKYRTPGEPIDRDGEMIIHTPGTKLTPKMAMYAAQQFLENFENTTPTAHVSAAVCKVKSSRQLVFEMRFHAEIGGLDPK